MRSFLVLILSGFLITSCSRHDNPIGLWDDNIELSTKTAVFSANADSITITTKGDFWWINAISFGDTIYSTHNRKDIDLESNSYVIREDCFRVERHRNSLFIMMNKNNTGVERVLKISLEAGDYFDGVCIRQSAN